MNQNLHPKQMCVVKGVLCMDAAKRESAGLLYGFFGVLAFSFTLPMTRIAVETMNPTFVGLGRAVIAGILAGIVLLIKRERFPTKAQLKSLAIVAIGVVIGFPLLTSWAMNQLPANHGAVVIALLPLATAGAAVFRVGERPSLGYWLASIAGSLIVLCFTFLNGINGLHWADLALIGAVLLAAVGYAEGGKLSAEMGSWQVISWALVLIMPFLLIPVAFVCSSDLVQVPLAGWLSFGYVSIISQFVGFLWWYRGMELGGVARVSQIQYVQPFLSIIWSGLLLGETITITTVILALCIVLTVAKGRKTSVRRRVAQEKSV